MPLPVCGDLKTICGGWFFFSTIWELGIKFKSPGLASAFAPEPFCWPPLTVKSDLENLLDFYNVVRVPASSEFFCVASQGYM